MSNTAYQVRKRRQQRAYDEFEKGDLALALHYFNGSCAYCHTKLDTVNRKQDNGLELDHFRSLAEQENTLDDMLILDGLTLKNTLPTCRKCNRRKKDANPEKWIRQTFGDKAQTILDDIDFYFATVSDE
jgi:5-methylcytosine-specific restriction endonuclease McrA